MISTWLVDRSVKLALILLQRKSNFAAAKNGQVSSISKNRRVGSNFTAAKNGQVSSNFAAAKNGKVGSNFAAEKKVKLVQNLLQRLVDR